MISACRQLPALRTRLKTIGQPNGPNDALIVAHALAVAAALVSGDAGSCARPACGSETGFQKKS